MTTSKRPPDDEPFDDNFDSYAKGLELRPYRFHWADRRWTMEHFDALGAKATEKAARHSDDEVFKLAMGDQQYTDFEATPLTNGVRREMVRRYFKHCGVTPGEL